jgi:hypothetical protein
MQVHQRRHLCSMSIWALIHKNQAPAYICQLFFMNTGECVITTLTHCTRPSSPQSDAVQDDLQGEEWEKSLEADACCCGAPSPSDSLAVCTHAAAAHTQDAGTQHAAARSDAEASPSNQSAGSSCGSLPPQKVRRFLRKTVQKKVKRKRKVREPQDIKSCRKKFIVV